MNKLEVLQNQMDTIMDTFEFNKILIMMESIGWNYGDINEDYNDITQYIPDQFNLRLLARRLMKTAIDSKSYVSTGGFRAHYTDGVENEKPWVKIELMWGIEAGYDGDYYDED